VPADERLREADLRDELGDRRGPGGESADDPQPVDVGERLVDDPKLAQLIRLEDGVREGASDASG
jgi:hypothetical protein